MQPYIRDMNRRFIKAWALGRMTNCEHDFAWLLSTITTDIFQKITYPSRLTCPGALIPCLSVQSINDSIPASNQGCLKKMIKTRQLPIGLTLACIVQAVTRNVLNHILLLVRLVITADCTVHRHLLREFLFPFRIYGQNVAKEIKRQA